jgi:hypothetical protein
VAWNLALAEQTRRDLIPRDDTVAFSRLAFNAAQVVSDRVGFPTTWPASWLFAWREALSPGRYDLGVGRYLFYRQNNLNGLIETGNPDHCGAAGHRLRTHRGRPGSRGTSHRGARARTRPARRAPSRSSCASAVRALEGPCCPSERERP